MNKLTTDLKSLHEATINNLKSSKANNTLRAYKSDFKDLISSFNFTVGDFLGDFLETLFLVGIINHLSKLI